MYAKITAPIKEHYGKNNYRVFNLKGLKVECDEKDYLKSSDADTILVAFDALDLPPGWIKDGEKLGFDPYKYVIEKRHLAQIQ